MESITSHRGNNSILNSDPKIRIPDGVLGGDLIWWRDSPTVHTTVTIWRGETGLRKRGTSQSNEIFLRLHDPGGKVLTSWTQSIRRGMPVIVDSKDHSGVIEEGVLAVFAISKNICVEKYRRLFSMVDWYTDDGKLVSLHSDHSVSTRTKPIEFTEVVFLETSKIRNFLVLVNGAEPQKPDSVALQVRNHRGELRSAVYSPAMAPFSLHKLCLSELLPGLREFCEGKHATLEGQFDAKNVFSRPYVMTDAGHTSGYHGGNRYEWHGIPGFIYKALGCGEVNPMVAIHSEALTTTVNLLNSHGDIEEDFWVDARLYDESGREVANRKKWLLARRYGLARGDIKDLLGDISRAFTGYIAINFSDDDKLFYPGHLQALLEYRTPVSTARVMAWSDIWNGRPAVRKVRDELAGFFDVNTLYGEEYLGGSEVRYRSHYRVWFRPPIRSFISVTNCGIAEDYDETVTFTIRLFNSRGETLSYHGSLGPHATAFKPVGQFFPSAEEFLAPGGIGVASVESKADLAVMQFSEHQISGVFSAEHFLASANYQDGKYYTSCGA